MEDNSANQENAQSIQSDVIGSASYCKSYKCKECKHYVKFLKCNTMHTICWNKDNWFEKRS